MDIIPINSVPNQSFSITLDRQYCEIALRTLDSGLFLDLSINNVPIVTGGLCLDRDRLIRLSYIKFNGDLAFADMQGTEAPVYTGLGDRFKLLFIYDYEL